MAHGFDEGRKKDLKGKYYLKHGPEEGKGDVDPGDLEVCLETVKEQSREVAEILLEAGNLKPGQIMVLGCSTSEVQGRTIGSSGSLLVARAILDGITGALAGTEVALAVQCCEHLNRCLVTERTLLEKYGLVEVAVRPVPNAGGATASRAMESFHDPVVVESLQAHAGIDIGDTFIGMHLKPVAVPVRLALHQIGHAHVTVARTRPKLVGGKRAVYE